ARAHPVPRLKPRVAEPRPGVGARRLSPEDLFEGFLGGSEPSQSVAGPPQRPAGVPLRRGYDDPLFVGGGPPPPPTPPPYPPGPRWGVPMRRVDDDRLFVGGGRLLETTRLRERAPLLVEGLSGRPRRVRPWPIGALRARSRRRLGRGWARTPREEHEKRGHEK